MGKGTTGETQPLPISKEITPKFGPREVYVTLSTDVLILLYDDKNEYNHCINFSKIALTANSTIIYIHYVKTK